MTESSRLSTSRIPGFYKKSLRQRSQLVADTGLLSPDSRRYLVSGGRLDLEVADRMTENVISTHALPLSVALNFRVNKRDVLVPMAVEEPSVVAAASNAARRVRMTGGFVGTASEPVMTAQVQFDEVPAPRDAERLVMAEREQIVQTANASIPSMVKRGGGCRDLDVRVLDEQGGVLVVHLYVDVRNAMGANVVDTVAEAVAPQIQELIGGNVGLRILSNLPLRRRVRVECEVSADALGGAELADGIVRASRFAELDPFRAVTHNKGIMNGIDAVALAFGQDWRAIEAGAHAFAAIDGRYKPLCLWKRTDVGIRGKLDMPLAVGTVGGAMSAHPGAHAALELASVDSAQDLACIMASAGVASNLAALSALAAEGIQHGHMRLHARKQELQQDASGRTESIREG